jgi:hypothetical protein
MINWDFKEARPAEEDLMVKIGVKSAVSSVRRYHERYWPDLL